MSVPQSPPESHPTAPCQSTADTTVHTIHLIAPVAVVTAALLLHAIRNPVPAATLLLLVSAAYGKTIWHDVLQHRTIAASFTRHERQERDERTTTITRTIRDTTLALQPTTR
jgi:hypothetical protein